MAGGQFLARHRRIRARDTTADDLSTILQIERDSDNRAFIGRWSRDEHIQSLGDPSIAHWTVEAEPDYRIIGHIILSNITGSSGSIEFVRIVMNEKRQGYGREAVRLVKRECFNRFGAHRLWLDVMEHNERARRLYQSEGFTEEGILRECLRMGDRFVSLVIMAILEREYRKEASFEK